MRKYRSIPALIILAVALIFLLNPENPRWIGILLLALSACGLIYASRGTLTFSKANKLISQKKPGFLEKALPLYKKSIKEGIPEQYQLIAATLLIQYGDMEFGKEALEELLESREKKIVFQAKEGLSMYYWIKKDLGRAIKICEEAKEMGYKDKILMKESYRAKLDSPALVDMQAAGAILAGDYEKAGNLSKTIFDSITPAYVDPYIHRAMVYIHYGEIEMALNCLESCLDACSFSNTSILTKKDIEEMISYLKDPSSVWSFSIAVNENPLELINGRLPKHGKIENKKPLFGSLPRFKAEAISKNDLSEVDENEPNTALTDEDEEWLKKHN